MMIRKWMVNKIMMVIMMIMIMIKAGWKCLEMFVIRMFSSDA